MGDRLQLAKDLMFLVGRYHDEDGTDRWYAKAASALREADAEIIALRAAYRQESGQGNA